MAERQEAIQSVDIAWLEKAREYDLLAQYYERLFNKTMAVGSALRASKYWRLAENPVQALAVTECMRHWRSRGIATDEEFAMILTTRGGAYRDLKQYTKAEQVAQWAAELNPSSCEPLVLLSMICSDTGNPESAFDYLSMARERGMADDIYKAIVGKYISKMRRGRNSNDDV